MAMQRKENDTGHVDECMADGVCIKETNKRSKLFVSSPSMTIITPSSIKPASARSTSTSSLCFNCNVKFPAALRFLPKTYCSDEVVKHGTGFATKARHIDRHYTQNRDTTFITNISLPHAAEHEWRLSSIGVVVEWIDTMINNLIGRKRSSDFHTVSFPLFAFTEVRQKDADAFKSASPYHVHSSSSPKCTSTDGNMRRTIDEGTALDGPDVDPPKAPRYPSPESVSNTHTKRKNHGEYRLNEDTTPIPDLFIKACIESKSYLFAIIALSCVAIGIFIKSFIRIKSIAFSVRKPFLLVLLALRFPLNSALSISTFSYHTCALQTNSTTPSGFNAFKCWGNNNFGPLGYEHTNNIGDAPNEMGAFLPNIDTNISIDDIQQVDAGGEHTCILTNGGKAKCWGSNGHGRLGYGNTVDKGNAPNTMGINLPFIDFGGSWLGTQIAAARYHTCALLSNDTTPDVIKCW
eukprot:721617_1